MVTSLSMNVLALSGKRVMTYDTLLHRKALLVVTASDAKNLDIVSMIW